MSTKNLIRRSVLRAGLRVAPQGTAIHNRLAKATLRTDIDAVRVFRAATPSGRKIRFCTPARSVVAGKVYWFGMRNYEQGTSAIFSPAAEGAKVCLDVGANVGYYALLAGVSNPNLSVYAFEPAPETFEQLSRNIELNDLHNVECIQAAVGDRVGTARLYLSDNDCSASLREGFREARGHLDVPATTIDEFVAERNIAKVDLIKIDVEGLEDRVLQGTQAVLRRDRPTIVCEVLAGRTEERLQRLMDEHGYAYALITPDGPVRRHAIQGDPTYTNLNYLFTPQVETLTAAVESAQSI